MRCIASLQKQQHRAAVTRHSNRGKCTVRPRNCSQIAEFRACLYSNRGQSGWERTPHRTSLSSWCARPLLPPSVVRCDSSGLLESVPQSAGALPAAEPRGMDAQAGDRTHQCIHGAELHVHHLGGTHPACDRASREVGKRSEAVAGTVAGVCREYCGSSPVDLPLRRCFLN